MAGRVANCFTYLHAKWERWMWARCGQICNLTDFFKVNVALVWETPDSGVREVYGHYLFYRLIDYSFLSKPQNLQNKT